MHDTLVRINKMKSILNIISLLISTSLVGQQHPYGLKFSHEIQIGIKEESIRSSTAGTLLSFIGDYYNSVKYSEIKTSWGVDTLDLNHYEIASAFEKIVEKAKQYKVVIISENHLKPQHRVFAKNIIVELGGMGFNQLGMEALSPIDTLLEERGYPLNHPMSGVYTMEPQMNKLVISALDADINLFAYEAIERDKTRDRDEIQADNIIKHIRSNPDSKFIILCGFHHVIESDLIKRGNSYWMAKYIKDKTGIDPLTIYQDNFTEKFKENEHPVLRTLTIEEPSVFINVKGEIPRLTKQVDIEVIHPKTYTINGRPNWLYERDSESIEIEKDNNLGYPQIVSAYRTGLTDSVPFDQIELNHKYDNKLLVLEPGSYRIKITDGQNEHEYIQHVK